MMATEPETATFDLEPAEYVAPTGPLAALGWLAFAVALAVSPALVWACWGWLL